TFRAEATAVGGVARLEFLVDDALRAAVTAPPFRWDFDTSTASNGEHRLTVLAYDLAGNVGRATWSFTTQNDTWLPRPSIPRHYPHIRIAELAYSGTPFGALEDDLLRNSVDLVIPDRSYAQHIRDVAPATPQTVYTNVSSVYGGLLTDWLNYAAARG